MAVSGLTHSDEGSGLPSANFEYGFPGEEDLANAYLFSFEACPSLSPSSSPSCRIVYLHRRRSFPRQSLIIILFLVTL